MTGRSAPAPPAAAADFDLVIEGGRHERGYWRDLWRYRELLLFLAWRDLLVRYKQTLLGVAWSVLRPLATMAVFTFVFSRVAGLPSEQGVPYPILVYAAMLPWNLFAGAMSDSSNSVVGSSAIVSKVYFPRLLIPASTVLVNVVDFLISLAVLLGLMLVLEFVPSWRMVLLPLLVLPALLGALGLGLCFAALNVRFRDVRVLIPFVTQFGLYLSPVGFSSNVVPEAWRGLYALNPMVGVIDSFRWAILGDRVEMNWPGFLLACGVVTALFGLGLWVFRRTERQFADVI